MTMTKFLMFSFMLVLCFGSAYLFRKSIVFLICPNRILKEGKRRKLFAIFSVIPSLLLMSYTVKFVEVWMNDISFFANYALYAGMLTLPIWIVLTGKMIDRMMQAFNTDYRIWRRRYRIA